MNGLVDAIKSNVIMLVLIAGVVGSWGLLLPPGPIVRHDWFELLKEMAALLGGGVLIGRPDFMKRAMGEPVIPGSVKALSQVADAAVARIQNADISNANKKEEAAATIQKSGMSPSSQEAHLAVELAVLKATGTGTGDGRS